MGWPRRSRTRRSASSSRKSAPASTWTPRSATSTVRLGPEVEAGAFTVLREAANNAVKTGRAPNVALDVTDEPTAVIGMVEDDGAGFDVAATLGSYSGRGSLGL